MRAVVAGAGIGGLAGAVALQRRGIAVTVLERAPQLNVGGAALSIWPNALRALDELGVGADVREHAALGGNSGVRRPDGRWLARAELGPAIAERFGDRLVLVARKMLADALLSRLPANTVEFGREATAVDAGNAGQRAVLHTDQGSIEADLIVAADGLRSRLRAALFPAAAGPTYAGYTAWRMVVATPENAESSETWGADGQRFAVLPLIDGTCYCYATAALPEATWFANEADELRRRFGDWHEPIRTIVNGLEPEGVLRNDIEELPPLPAVHRGRVALLGDAAHAMTPDLGQGACQAIEDAVVLASVLDGADPGSLPGALGRYTASRLPRTSDIARRSHKAGTFYSRPLKLQWAAARVLNVVPAAAMVRSLTPVVGWKPPKLNGAD